MNVDRLLDTLRDAHPGFDALPVRVRRRMAYMRATPDHEHRAALSDRERGDGQAMAEILEREAAIKAALPISDDAD